MKTFSGTAIINDDFDNQIRIIDVEAINIDEAEDKMIDLVYEQRDEVDQESDTVDIVDLEES